jgi:hypothetical protein
MGRHGVVRSGHGCRPRRPYARKRLVSAELTISERN